MFFWGFSLAGIEWFAIAEATKAGRYSLENGNTGSQPYTPAPLQADCHEIHETAATLLATLGQPIFEPLVNAPPAKGAPELFYCKGSGANGVGEYTAEGFVVLKGSKGRLVTVASYGAANEAMRAKLISSGVMQEEGGFCSFCSLYRFWSARLWQGACFGAWHSRRGQGLQAAAMHQAGHRLRKQVDWNVDGLDLADGQRNPAVYVLGGIRNDVADPGLDFLPQRLCQRIHDRCRNRLGNALKGTFQCRSVLQGRGTVLCHARLQGLG